MRLGGRIAAAIEILETIETQHRPVKLAVKEWGAAHRFAGSGDRAFISGLVMDALRHKLSLAHAMQDDSARALALGVVGRIWGQSADNLAAAFAEDQHAPEPPTEAETAGFARDIHDAPVHVRGDFPEWLEESMLRVFGEQAAEEGAAMAQRAPVDLRVNELKSDPDKALAAVIAKIPAARAGALARSCIRIPQTDPTGKSAPADSIPAYGKGWVEVQDEGSQIAGLAAGVKPGDQVLDLCAGAGGKTLELAAMTGNTGQIHAWDIDWRRLRAIWPRLQRAGVRNVQVHDGPEEELAELEGKMDVVFVDAPCTGTGTWRRRPDAKWRVSEKALNQRLQEQDEVLDTAAKYVKPGGRLVYVTCSILPEENSDRVEAFLARDRGFNQLETLEELKRSGGLADGAVETLKACEAHGGALQLSPRRSATDGFFIAVMQRA
ncbi:RsmB/NOP family class I SAM-dependent RNA methyltransferase [Hyphobacterium sp.]|uniref:RsmB/NOP family class I SAM-dependent RNA methyltransferase n=1 Tax=Hyphobacterium sp. TaxID=2004662 RepID=UPI003BAA45F4